MKPLLILLFIVGIATSCKKNEIAPTASLTNTMWTGIFRYSPVKHNQIPQQTLGQCFAMSFLPNGVFKFYEALGESGGSWTLSDDNILTITQANKNVIQFEYNATNETLTFKSITGPPAEWTSRTLKKSTVNNCEQMENAKSCLQNSTIFIIFKTDAINGSYIENNAGRQAIKKIETVALSSGAIYIYRNSGEVYSTVLTGGYSGLTYIFSKKP